MKTALAIFLAAAALASPAAAQDKGLKLSAEYDRCLATGDAAKGKTSAIDICIGLERRRQEERMRVVFYETSDEHGWKWQDYIRDQQAIWRQRSSERCGAKVAADRRESLDSRLFNQCMLGEILSQIAWLESLPPE